MSEELRIDYLELENLANNLIAAADNFSMLSAKSNNVLNELMYSIQKLQYNLDSIQMDGENVISKIRYQVSDTVNQSWQGQRAELFSSSDFPEIEENYASVESVLFDVKEKLRFLLTETEESILSLIHKMDVESTFCQSTSDQVKMYMIEHKEVDATEKIS